MLLLTMPLRLFFIAASLAFVASLGGCASPEAVGSVFVAPGKYVLYSCPELVRRQGEIVGRRKELEGLMAKAESDVGGRVVSTMAYRGEYDSLFADMKVLRQEAADKQCTLPDPDAPPAAAAPAPAPKPKRATH